LQVEYKKKYCSNGNKLYFPANCYKNKWACRQNYNK